jgi:hypothetical protein
MDFVNPLKKLRIILVSMACFMIFLMVFFPGNFIVLDALHREMSGRLAFYLLVVLLLGKLPIPESFCEHS